MSLLSAATRLLTSTPTPTPAPVYPYTPAPAQLPWLWASLCRCQHNKQAHDTALVGPGPCRETSCPCAGYEATP